MFSDDFSVIVLILNTYFYLRILDHPTPAMLKQEYGDTFTISTWLQLCMHGARYVINCHGIDYAMYPGLPYWRVSSTSTVLVLRNDNDRQCKYISTFSLMPLSGRMSYHKIWWSLQAAKFGVGLFQTLWNLTGSSVAALSRCLSNCRAVHSL